MCVNEFYYVSMCMHKSVHVCVSENVCECECVCLAERDVDSKHCSSGVEFEMCCLITTQQHISY